MRTMAKGGREKPNIPQRPLEGMDFTIHDISYSAGKYTGCRGTSMLSFNCCGLSVNFILVAMIGANPASNGNSYS